MSAVDECRACGFKCPDEEDMNRHLVRVHPGAIAAMECERCGGVLLVGMEAMRAHFRVADPLEWADPYWAN
jgi:hypothetical protein